MANQETFRQISDRFDVTLSAAHSVISKIITVLTTISDQYISWPYEEQCFASSQALKNTFKVDGVIGAIDGSFLNIKSHAMMKVIMLIENATTVSFCKGFVTTEDMKEVPVNRLTKYQQVQPITQHSWR